MFHLRCVAIIVASLTCRSDREGLLKQSEMFRDNAENCALLAESAPNGPAYQRYRRMEAAWAALAEEQDWLDGEVSPMRQNNAPRQRQHIRAS
jgi:hypothetical protein